MPVLVDDGLEVLHMGHDVLEFGSSLLGLLLVVDLPVVLRRFHLYFLLLDFLFLGVGLLIKLILQLQTVLIAAVIQIINGHKNLTQIEVLIAELLIAPLHLRLDLVLFLQLLFDLAR